MALLSVPLLLSVALSTSSPSPVSQCDDAVVDLRTSGQSAAGLPHFDQGDTNLCAPYTAAQMIDAWRTAQKGTPLLPKERIAPIPLAVEFAAQNSFPYSFPIQNSTDPFSQEPRRWGGMACVFVRSAREIGACRAETTGELHAGGENLIATEAVFLLLRDFARKDVESRVRDRARIAQEILAALPLRASGGSPGNLPTLATIEKELANFHGDDPYVPLSRILFEGCSADRIGLGKLPRCQTSLDAGMDAFGWTTGRIPFRATTSADRINALLSRPKTTPVAIAYCHRVIPDGRDYLPDSILRDSCSQHWSLVLGRRKIEGRCQYLVRDTSGGRNDFVSEDWEFDQGDVWIDADTLMSSVYALQWLQD